MNLKVMVVFALAIPAGVFAVQAPAVAGTGPATGVTRQVDVAVGGFTQTVSLCPVGKAVLGGGALVRLPASNVDTVVRESAPDTLGGQSLWLASVSNNNAVAHTIGIHAICANPPAGYQVVRKDVTVAAGRVILDIAVCPAGKVIVGGGGVVAAAGAGNFNTVVQETTPGVNASGQSFWYLTFRNDGPVARTVAILAVCAYPLPGYQLVRTDVALPAFGSIYDISLCPVGKVVLGGGGLVVGSGLGDFKTMVRETGPATYNRGEQATWVMHFRNNSAVARTAAIMAVCANAPAGYQIVRTDVTLA
jgi:hypothetical protein